MGPSSKGCPAGYAGRALSAAIAVLLASPWAHAQAAPKSPPSSTKRAQGNEPMIGILRIDTTGVSDAAELRFEQGVSDGLTGAGFRVMDRASVGKALVASTGYVEGCSFGPCLRAVSDATGVDTVLVARIEGVGRTYSFVVSLMDTRSGHLLSQVAQNCSVCTVEDAITTATLSAVELVLGVDEARTPRDRSVRATPAPVHVDPRAGVGRSLRWVGWTGVVVGVAAAGGGALLYRQKDHAWGAGVGGAGVALLGAGGVMLVFGGRLD